jgi:hypothetical protein
MKSIARRLALGLTLAPLSLAASEALASDSDYIRETVYIRADLGLAFTSNEDLLDTDYPEPDFAGAGGLGIYLSLNDSFMLGLSADSIAEAYEATGFGSTVDVTHTVSQLSLSSMYFPGERLGEGFFVRADVGKPELTVSVEQSGVTSETDLSSSYQPALGLGMTVPVSSESRWIFSLMYYSGTFEFDSGTEVFEKEGLKLTVGGLW